MRPFCALYLLTLAAGANADSLQTPSAGFSGPLPYAFEPWPSTNYPGRAYPSRTGLHGNKASSRLSKLSPKQQMVYVGISVEKYLSRVNTGGKIHLPAPAGECNVGGNLASARELTSCFAALAAR